MKSIKNSYFSIFRNSLYIEVLIFLLIAPWMQDIMKNFFNNKYSLLILFIVLLYGLLFLIFFLFYMMVSYEINDKAIIKRIKFFKFKYEEYRYFKKERIIVRRKRNFILSLFYLEKFQIFYNYKRLFSILLDEDTIREILSSTLNIVSNEKKHFEKDTDYYSNSSTIIYSAINNIYSGALYYLIYLFIINVTNFTYFYINEVRISLALLGLILDIIIYIIILLSIIFGSIIVNTKVENNRLHILKGLFQKNESYVPLDIVLRSTIKLGILSSVLNSYQMLVRHGMFRLNIPLTKENIDMMFKNKYNFDTSNYYVNIVPIIISTILITSISILLFLINRFSGTIFFIASSIIVFNQFFMGRIFKTNDSYIIFSGFLSKKLKIINYSKIKKIEYKRILKIVNLYIIDTDTNKYFGFIRTKNINNLSDNNG